MLLLHVWAVALCVSTSVSHMDLSLLGYGFHGLWSLLTVWIVRAICSRGFWPNWIKFLYFNFHPL